MDFATVAPAVQTIIPVSTFNPNYLLNLLDEECFDTFRLVVERLKRHRTRYLYRFACSFGKDSVLIVTAGLQAHIELVQEGLIDPDSPFIVTNIDTMVDDVYVRAQVAYEVRELKAYCQRNNINLIYRTATPPLRYSWAVLYLSGMKLPSFAKSSADCSVILKVDPAKTLERELSFEFGFNIATVMGVRSDEGARRSSSIKRHQMDDVDVVSKIIDGKEVRSLAPIIDLDADEVFAILRRAGSNPIVPVANPKYKIPSYKPHNHMLIKLYGDSQDTCPVTSFQSPAAEAKKGGCGASRFGCYLCLKVTVDKSANSRTRFKQYDRVKNITAIRDWMAFNADNMSLRTPMGKSICPVTHAVVVQENTYSAETLEKLIFWLAQATRDDAIYAANFKELLKQNRLHEDAGYNEIKNDSSLTDDLREFFLDAYVSMSQEHLITPLNLEQILMICAIHARDGVALPPYRALWIWDQVQQGNYIPYPTIDTQEPQRVDPVPEPRFYMGNFKPAGQFGLMSLVTSYDSSCDVKHNDAADSERRYARSVFVSSFVKPVSSSKRFSWTRRKIVSRRKVDGKVVLTKGRMSVQFSPVTYALKSAVQTMEILVPTTEKHAVADLQMAMSDDVESGFSLNDDSVDYFLMTEYERCLAKHNDFVSSRGMAFGGTDPFLFMAHYGLFQFTARSAQSSERILNRTNALSMAVGGVSLLNMTKEQLMGLTVCQSTFRSIKAQELALIRKRNNAAKTKIRSELQLLQTDPKQYIEIVGERAIASIRPLLSKMLTDLVVIGEVLQDGKISHFDGVNLRTYADSTIACIKDLSTKFGTIDGLLAQLHIDKSNIEARRAAAVVANNFADLFNGDGDVVPTTFTMLASWADIEIKPEAVSATLNSLKATYAPKDARKSVYMGNKRIVDVTQLSIFGLQS